MLTILCLLLCSLHQITFAASKHNIFGIGLVNEGNTEELDKAQGIGGDRSWILPIFAGISKTTTAPQAGWVTALQGIYARNMSVIVRLNPPFGSEHYRDESDDPQHLNYTTLGQAYAKVVAALPKPKATPWDPHPILWLQIENEPNLCTEWWCQKPGPPLSYQEIAKEYAHFHMYVYKAIKALNEPTVRVCTAPLAPGGAVSCGCCGSSSCKGDRGGTTGLDFMNAMIEAIPNIYQDYTDCLCSHSYPAAKIGSNFFVPFPQAKPGLTYYVEELKTIKRSNLPVFITETGWPTHDPGHPKCTEQQKAQWTVDAYGLWMNMSVVPHGVTPFMLQDAYWGKEIGFEYVKVNGQVAPVYTAVKNKRCSLGFGPC